MGNRCCRPDPAPPTSEEATPPEPPTPDPHPAPPDPAPAATVAAASPLFGAVTAALPFGAPRRVIVYDFDCTITSRHLYKCLANWAGYAENFERWLTEQDIPSPLGKQGQSVAARMGFGGGEAGRACLRKVVREYFLGGEARTARLTEHFRTLREEGGCRAPQSPPPPPLQTPSDLTALLGAQSYAF